MDHKAQVRNMVKTLLKASVDPHSSNSRGIWSGPNPLDMDLDNLL